jgi:hypothetical protein
LGLRRTAWLCVVNPSKGLVMPYLSKSVLFMPNVLTSLINKPVRLDSFAQSAACMKKLALIFRGACVKVDTLALA